MWSMMGSDLGVSRQTVVVLLGSEGWRKKEGMGWGDLTRNLRTRGTCFTPVRGTGRPGEVSCIHEDMEFIRY